MVSVTILIKNDQKPLKFKYSLFNNSITWKYINKCHYWSKWKDYFKVNVLARYVLFTMQEVLVWLTKSTNRKTRSLCLPGEMTIYLPHNINVNKSRGTVIILVREQQTTLTEKDKKNLSVQTLLGQTLVEQMSSTKINELFLIIRILNRHGYLH